MAQIDKFQSIANSKQNGMVKIIKIECITYYGEGGGKKVRYYVSVSIKILLLYFRLVHKFAAGFCTGQRVRQLFLTSTTASSTLERIS